MGERDQAFLLLTHQFSAVIAHEFEKLARASEEFGEAWLVAQEGGRHDPSVSKPSQVMKFSPLELVAMGYPMFGTSMVPGSSHFPVLKFFLEHPGFRHYWLIEYDVRFTGDWRVLFEVFSALEGDLITSHIRTHAEEPGWCFWGLSSPGESIPVEQQIRCFHPIYRISNAALAFIHGAHRDGWRGHSEALIPTVLHRNGFALVDFGGAGGFVPEGFENQYYIDSKPSRDGTLDRGTMRYRPIFVSPGPRKNTLYHPVKPEWVTRPWVTPLDLRRKLSPIARALARLRGFFSRASPIRPANPGSGE